MREPLVNWPKQRPDPKTWLVVVFLTAAVFAGAARGVHYSRNEKPKYTESECIVRIRVSYPEESTSDDVNMYEKRLFEFFPEYFRINSIPIGAFGFEANRERYFFEFFDYCEYRSEFARAAVRAFSKRFPVLMKFEFLEEPAGPGDG